MSNNLVAVNNYIQSLNPAEVRNDTETNIRDSIFSNKTSTKRC